MRLLFKNDFHVQIQVQNYRTWSENTSDLAGEAFGVLNPFQYLILMPSLSESWTNSSAGPASIMLKGEEISCYELK